MHFLLPIYIWPIFPLLNPTRGQLASIGPSRMGATSCRGEGGPADHFRAQLPWYGGLKIEINPLERSSGTPQPSLHAYFVTAGCKLMLICPPRRDIFDPLTRHLKVHDHTAPLLARRLAPLLVHSAVGVQNAHRQLLRRACFSHILPVIYFPARQFSLVRRTNAKSPLGLARMAAG